MVRLRRVRIVNQKDWVHEEEESLLVKKITWRTWKLIRWRKKKKRISWDQRKPIQRGDFTMPITSWLLLKVAACSSLTTKGRSLKIRYSGNLKNWRLEEGKSYWNFIQKGRRT